MAQFKANNYHFPIAINLPESKKQVEYTITSVDSPEKALRVKEVAYDLEKLGINPRSLSPKQQLLIKIYVEVGSSGYWTKVKDYLVAYTHKPKGQKDEALEEIQDLAREVLEEEKMRIDLTEMADHVWEVMNHPIVKLSERMAKGSVLGYIPRLPVAGSATK